MSTPGDFSFVNDATWRESLTHDYKCLTPECWTALRNHDETKSFLWETHGHIWDMIRADMWGGHSGASMALSLRDLERIAKFGWDAFVRYYTVNQKKEESAERFQSEYEQRQRSQSS